MSPLSDATVFFSLTEACCIIEIICKKDFYEGMPTLIRRIVAGRE